MRADRLLNLLLLLQNGEMMTTNRLAAELEVSVRTILRDMEALGAAGIPVYAERGPLGGWRLAEGYRTRLTGLTPKELLSLLLLLPSGVFHDLEIRRDFDQAFRKLVAAAPAHLRQYADTLRNRLHIDGAAWLAQQASPNGLSVVQQAVWENRKLAIRYDDVMNNTFEGIVEPLGLIAKRNLWYMAAKTKQEVLSFRVSRLRDVQLMEETFERPADFDLAHYWEQASVHLQSVRWRFTVLLKIREEQLDAHPAAGNRQWQVRSRKPIGNGWVEAEMDYRSREAAVASILGLGTQAEVLSPADVREEVGDTAWAIAAMYGSEADRQ